MIYSFIAAACAIAVVGISLLIVEIKNAKEVDPKKPFLHDDFADEEKSEN